MLFRNRRVARAVAGFLLLQSVTSIALPSVSWALSGPSQPEFTTYGAPGATDLVNLSTGDFSYSLPVLDLPGPERGFSLPLTYKGGIQLEQEASWVGLGWSLNPGALARSVNGYADDANNEPTQITFNKKVDRGWRGGVPGVLDLGWNSITGHSGSVDLLGLAKIGWDNNGINQGDLVGVSYTKGSGVSVDPVRMALAVVTVATLGASSPLSLAANVGIQVASSVAIGVGMSAAGLGHLEGVSSFNNQPTRSVEQHLWGDNYWNFFKSSTTENAYGSLYFGKMSRNTTSIAPHNNDAVYGYTGVQDPPTIYYGSQAAPDTKIFVNHRESDSEGNRYVETAADVYQDATIRRDKDLLTRYDTGDPVHSLGYEDYKSPNEVSNRPLSTAHDYFSVMGEAVTGTIRPYRLEVGSVAYPKLLVNPSQDGSVAQTKYMVAPFLDDYKVGFRYENSLANGYSYHRYTPAAGGDATGFDFGQDKAAATKFDPKYSLTIADARLLTARTEGSRKGLHNAAGAGNAPQMDRQFVQGKHVAWYSNAEISAMYAGSADGAGTGFLEFEHPVAAAGSNNPFRAAAPPSGIGAFEVTAEDGTTYHYALPVYQFQTYTESNEVQNATTIGELGKSTRRTGVGSPGNPSGAYATSWLLTAITSADYIDRNHSGTVDAADWGGWVKLEYGQFSSQYKWRQPYLGTSYSDESAEISNRSFTEGYKQTYYLNAIATRSHTALFIKSVRQDGRGHFRPGVTAATSNLGIDEQAPASALRLDEVVLLDNATLTKLRTAGGVAPGNSSTPVPALTNATSAGARAAGALPDDPVDGSGDNIDHVLDTHDLDADARIRQFVDANALKRVHFNYGYDLCRGVPSSFQCVSNQPGSLPPMDDAHAATNRGGKLTLKSVSFYGPTVANVPTKIIPDFVFSYESATADVGATNPGYGPEKWDAFGMYQPYGQATVASHRPLANTYAAPWSLTKITSPLGGTTEITYDRDEYAHVSEYGAFKAHLSNPDCSSVFTLSFPTGVFRGSLTDALQPGQTIELTGVTKFSDWVIHKSDYYPREIRIPTDHYYQQERFRVQSVNGTQVTLAQAPEFSKTRDGEEHQDEPIVGKGAEFDFVLPNNVPGGDVRVAALTTRDENAAYQVRYKYEDPALGAWQNSTGVLAKEPPFLDRFDHLINGEFDYPTTPVLYSQVTVLRGLFRQDAEADHEVREVYAFYTPTTAMIRSNNNSTWRAPTGIEPNAPVSVQFADNQTVVDLGKIGEPRKVEVYNRQNVQELATDFSYASAVSNADGLPGQGHYTEGILDNQRIANAYNINRSTKEYVPSVLVGSRSTRNGLSIANRNVLYDFYTGQVLETAFTNSLGKVYHSRSVPAYTLPGNEGMGAKGDNRSNSHMLAQQGAFYTYTEVPGGPAYDPLNPLDPNTSHVLSAGVQTWQSVWANYREADGNGAYRDVAGQAPVWRQAAAYAWQSPKLAADGSYQDFVPYNWTGAADAHWLKAGETVRYDHYSHALETRDVNGQSAAQKTGYDQTQLIAAATNARYTELAYSGAEDQLTVAGATHFGGEVVAGGTPDNQKAHTGFYSNQLAAGQKGFVYRAQAGRDVDLGKTYRITAWASADAPDSKLYVSVNGNRLPESALVNQSRKKAGAWSLLSALVTVPTSATGQLVEFGCVNDGTAPANFDDFRVAPLTATVASKVYDPRTNQLLYALDNDNLYTRYEYTPTGRLLRVYQETLDRSGDNSLTEKKVKEYDYNFARLYFPSWMSVAYRCQTNALGEFTGYEERQVVDANPLNNPPTPSKWELNSYLPICMQKPCTATPVPAAPTYTVCLSDLRPITIAVTPASGPTSYTWTTLTSGLSINSGGQQLSNTASTSVSVSFAANTPAGEYPIYVNATGSCGTASDNAVIYVKVGNYNTVPAPNSANFITSNSSTPCHPTYDLITTPITGATSYRATLNGYSVAGTPDQSGGYTIRFPFGFQVNQAGGVSVSATITATSPCGTSPEYSTGPRQLNGPAASPNNNGCQ